MNKQKQIIDDRLEAWLTAAPKPAASPEFCTRVMRAIEARPLPWRVRLYRFLFVPHTLNWNIAGAGGAAFVLVVGLGLGLAVLDRPFCSQEGKGWGGTYGGLDLRTQ